MKIVHWVQVLSVWLVSGEDIDAKAPIQENETFVLNNSVVYCNSIWKNCGGCVVDMKGASHYCEKVQNLLHFPSLFFLEPCGKEFRKIKCFTVYMQIIEVVLWQFPKPIDMDP